MDQIGAVKRYVGTSAEPKPTPSPVRLVPVGSTFTETDTRRVHLFDGQAWRPAEPDSTDAAVGVLAEILAELRLIRELLEQ